MPLIGLTANSSLPEASKLTEQQQNIDSGNITEDPLRGLIINETVTVLGWDFYKSFSTTWQAMHAQSDITLTITERPTAKYGSEIKISYKRQNMYQTFLSPARSEIKEETRKAVGIVYENIVNSQIRQRLHKSQDMGPKEF